MLLRRQLSERIISENEIAEDYGLTASVTSISLALQWVNLVDVVDALELIGHCIEVQKVYSSSTYLSDNSVKQCYR